MATTALFVEVSLWFLRGRLRREASYGPTLQGWEWGLPAGLIGGTLVIGTAALIAVIATWEVLSSYFG